MKVGVISDTHGWLDPKVFELFTGVSHILHAGDIGPDALIAELETIAPVTAVIGNTDSSPTFRLSEVITRSDRFRVIRPSYNPWAVQFVCEKLRLPPNPGSSASVSMTAAKRSSLPKNRRLRRESRVGLFSAMSCQS